MRLRTLALSSVLSLSTLFLASCASGTSSNSGGGGGGSNPTAQKYIYTTVSVSSTTSALVSYPANSTGAVTATSTITAPTGTLYGNLCHDAASNIYVLAHNTVASNFSVNVYSASNGVLTLSRSFVITVSGNVTAMTADPTGIVYTWFGTGALYSWPATASGSTASYTHTITTANYGDSLATDSSGNVYASESNGVLVVYPAGLSSSTPLHTINFLQASPLVVGDYNIALDSSNNLYFLSYSFAGNSAYPLIYVYNSGNFSTPTRTIPGAPLATLLVDLGIDSAGNLYADSYLSAARTFLVLPPTSSSLSTPTSTFTASGGVGAPSLFSGIVIE